MRSAREDSLPPTICISRTQKFQPMGAAKTILIFAEITGCREYAPLHRMTASAKNVSRMEKVAPKAKRIKPLYYRVCRPMSPVMRPQVAEGVVFFS